MIYRSRIDFKLYWYSYKETEIKVFWHLLVHNPYASLHDFADEKFDYFQKRPTRE